MKTLLEASKTPAELLKAANEHVRDWLNRRLDYDSVDIARLYQASRDRLTTNLRGIYDTYLAEDPSYVKARSTGAFRQMQAKIDRELDQLTDEVGQRATAKMADMLNTQPDVLERRLAKLLKRGSFLKLPVTNQHVLGELTTSVIGGATFEDRIMSMTDDMKRVVTNDLRRGLINGDDFATIRAKVSKTFGVDKLKKPAYNAYGSVKVYKNEARRQWNLLMKQQGERLESYMVWFAMIDDPNVTPGCAARHGLRIDEDLGGDGPPRHYNSCHPSTMVRGTFLAAYRMMYHGPMLTFQTKTGKMLTVTPNHPVLTSHAGMIPARELCKGDKLFLDRTWNKVDDPGIVPSGTTAPNKEKDRPTSIENVFNALAVTHGISRHGRITQDFHGDAKCGQGDIDVVVANYELWHRLTQLRSPDDFKHFSFEHATLSEEALAGHGNATLVSDRILQTSSVKALSLRVDVALELPPQTCCIAPTPDLDTLLYECLLEHPTREIEFSRDLIERETGLVLLDELVDIREFDYLGHVYDLQTLNSCINANGIIISNCRCTIMLIDDLDEIKEMKMQATAVLGGMGYTRRAARMEEMQAEYDFKPGQGVRGKYFEQYMHEAWDPSQHPRGEGGKFGDSPGGTAGPDEIKAWAADAGAKFDGIQSFPSIKADPLVLITDKKTGSTGVIPISKISAATIKAKVDAIRASFKQEAGWAWGHEILQPVSTITAVVHEAGSVYKSMPWRSLPREAVGYETGTWGSLLTAVATDRPDSVLLRKRAGHAVEVRSWASWRPVEPRAYPINTLQGIVDDSAVIQPPWDVQVARLPREILSRWPALRTVTFPVIRNFAIALVDQQTAENLTTGAMSPADVRWNDDADGNFLQALMTMFWRQGHPPNPHFVFGAMIDGQVAIRTIVNVTTGEVIYAADDFASEILAPYTRVAAAVLERDGRIWAIMPRGLARWVLPGGHIDDGESARDAVVREMLEETGQHIRVIRLLGTLYRPWSRTQVFLCANVARHREWSSSAETDAVLEINFKDLATDERLFLQRHNIHPLWSER